MLTDGKNVGSTTGAGMGRGCPREKPFPSRFMQHQSLKRCSLGGEMLQYSGDVEPAAQPTNQSREFGLELSWALVLTVCTRLGCCCEVRAGAKPGISFFVHGNSCSTCLHPARPALTSELGALIFIPFTQAFPR